MLTEPGITLARVGHALLKGEPRHLGALIDGHAEPALGDQQVGDAASPVAGPDDPHGDAVGDVILGHQRVDADVALTFELSQGAVNRQISIESADASPAGAAVGGTARYPQLEGERPGVCGGERGAGGFGDDARVTSVTTPERSERAEAPVLLTDHAMRG